VVWKKTGINPVVFKGTDSAHDFIGTVSKAIFAVVLLVVLVYSVLPDVYAYLMPIPWLQHPWIRSTGVVLLIGRSWFKPACIAFPETRSFSA
jgi:hypothetical protein